MSLDEPLLATRRPSLSRIADVHQPVEIRSAIGPAQTLRLPDMTAIQQDTPHDPRLSSTSNRTRLRVHPERTAPDEIADILRAGLVAHVAVADESGAVAIPMTYAVDDTRPGTIYIHGAHHSRLMRLVATGQPICVTVTMVDGLVYSRTALYHSVNYRSAVCFGPGRVVDDPEEQRRASVALVARYFPGRTEGVDYAPIPDEHLKGTAFVAIEVTDASAKVRRGGPKGPRDNDPTAPGTAGVIQFDPAR